MGSAPCYLHSSRIRSRNSFISPRSSASRHNRRTSCARDPYLIPDAALPPPPPLLVPNPYALHTSPARKSLGWIPPLTRSPANQAVHAGRQPPPPAAPSPGPWPLSGSALPRRRGELVDGRGHRDPRDTRRMKRGSPRRSRRLCVKQL
jgi:hypothetical protein